MTWIASPVAEDRANAKYLYELSKRHKLVPDNLVNAIEYYNRAAQDCFIVIVSDKESGERVGDVVFTEIVDGEQACVDFVPNPKFFAPGEDYQQKIFDVVNPILVKLMEKRNLRRIDALVPQTRCRTKKALKACGFKVEGMRRDAIKFKGKPPEGQTIMGILPNKE